MSTEENKAIARRWNEEFWNKGNIAAIDELFTADFVFNYPPPGELPNRDGYKQFVTRYASTWANTTCAIEDMVVEGDKVAVRWTWSGTHVGELKLMGIPPTGKRVTMTGISILHIVGGKIAEEWTQEDMLGTMGQLGVFPPSNS